MRFRSMIAVAAFACVAATTPAALFPAAMAQPAPPPNPTATNVIPEGGSFAVQGRVQAINPGARTLTVIPASNTPLPMVAAHGVDLSHIASGDTVSVHYTRAVIFVIASPETRVPPMSTERVAQLARQPGGVGPNAMTLQGVITRLDGPNAFDMVDATGGGVYTIRVTDPARVAFVSALRVGETVTVNVGPLIATAVAKCGWFGC